MLDLELYLHGRCHFFALALNKALGFPIECLWDNEAWFEDGDPSPALVHAYCIRPDGTRVDAQGTLTREAALENYAELVEEPEFVVTTAEALEEHIRAVMLPAEPGEIEQLISYIQ